MMALLLDHPILAALIALGGLSIAIGAVLGFAAVTFKVEGDPLVEQIDKILPQTQCGQCGYPGCRPYAEAIASGDIINKCPPGGQATVNNLADLLGVSAPALDADENADNSVKKVAFIREDECIGCTKCIQACPVDAIVGAAKQMHTVLIEACTGCDLCVEPCPVDCIDMLPVTLTLRDWGWEMPKPAKGSLTKDHRIIATDLSPGQAA
jgi:Na+-translocating ferredoxin:NAD+ oxidoreductase subunit B